MGPAWILQATKEARAMSASRPKAGDSEALSVSAIWGSRAVSSHLPCLCGLFWLDFVLLFQFNLFQF